MKGAVGRLVGLAMLAALCVGCSPRMSAGLRMGYMERADSYNRLVGIDLNLRARDGDSGFGGVGLSLGYEPGHSSWSPTYNIDGIGVCLFEYSGVRGLQVGAVCMSDDVYGLQIGGVSLAAEKVIGLQIGGVSLIGELAGLQVGAVSLIGGEELAGLQVGAVSLAWDAEVRGLQAGAVCMSEELWGVQLGGCNLAGEAKGLQLGVVNHCKKMQGVQIGLVNIIEEGAMKCLPIVNARF